MRSGYFHFGNSRDFIQLSSFVFLLQMLANIGHPDIEQLSHRLLRSPNRLILYDHLHLAILFWQLVQNKLYLFVHITSKSLFNSVLYSNLFSLSFSFPYIFLLPSYIFHLFSIPKTENVTITYSCLPLI